MTHTGLKDLKDVNDLNWSWAALSGPILWAGPWSEGVALGYGWGRPSAWAYGRRINAGAARRAEMTIRKIAIRTTEFRTKAPMPIAARR